MFGGMTTQITVRLDDDNVRFIDSLVERGEVKSRAAAIDQALRRARRDAEEAQEIAEFLANGGADPEMTALAQASWASLDRSWGHLD